MFSESRARIQTENLSRFEGRTDVGVFGFDAESTLLDAEGIDELAKRFGVHKEIKAVTANGMNGQLPFHESLAQRLIKLNEVRPIQARDFEFLRQLYVRSIIPGAQQTLRWARQQGPVSMISGGFRTALGRVARRLKFEDDDIQALEYDFQQGIAKKHPLLDKENRGKHLVLEQQKQKHLNGTAHKSLNFMIGDGMTDAAASFADGRVGSGVRNPDTAFIAVGEKQTVIAVADGYAPTIADVADVIREMCAQLNIPLVGEEQQATRV